MSFHGARCSTVFLLHSSRAYGREENRDLKEVFQTTQALASRCGVLETISCSQTGCLVAPGGVRASSGS